MTESLLLAFSMGLLGSVHCMGMCGGLVSSLSMSRKNIWWLGLATYQAGRLTSYVVLGLVSGLLGQTLVQVGNFSLAQKILTVVAGAVIIVFGLNLAGWLPDPLVRWTRLVTGWIGFGKIIRSVSARASVIGWYGLGLANGLLPCGLVYAALGLAMASAVPAMAALMMLAFGLGTVPMMMFVPALIRKISPQRRGQILRLVGVMVVLVGILTVGR